MTFDAFIATAWNDHGDRPQEVADRLTASLPIIETAEQIAPFGRLVTHVFGEHLGQWQQGIALLESLRNLPAFDRSAAVTSALARNIAVLRYASGDHAALEGLAGDDRVAVLAIAASAFAERGAFGQALAAYGEAVRLADAGLPPGSPAIRALAVGGNQLAVALERKQDRNAAEAAGMIAAAEGGLRYWKQAGTWVEEERAEYRLARSLLHAGQADAAVERARRCLAICSANDAPAFEQFFGYAVLALTQRGAGDAVGFKASRDQARHWLDLVPADEKQWCESDFAELAD